MHGFYQCTLFTCNFSLLFQANDFTSWTLLSLTCVCIYMHNVIDKVLLRKEVKQKVQIREYKYKKILRQCSILAINFWSVTYFGVLNFGTSYLVAKIGQYKTMTKICRFTVHEHKLEIVDLDQCLRVTIHTTINWNSHIESITKKTTRTGSLFKETCNTVHKEQRMHATQCYWDHCLSTHLQFGTHLPTSTSSN